MSGGNYDYICYKVDTFIDELKTNDDPRRLAFKELMVLVSKALHDIEWTDSGDYGDDADHKAIDAVFAFLKSDPEIIKKAHAYDKLKEQLGEFFREKK